MFCKGLLDYGQQALELVYGPLQDQNLHTYYQMHGWVRLLLGPWHLVLGSMAFTEVFVSENGAKLLGVAYSLITLMSLCPQCV